MVAIEHHRQDERAFGVTDAARPVAGALVWPLAAFFRVGQRIVAGEIQRQRVRQAAKISAAAGICPSGPQAEPARLNPSLLSERLTAHTVGLSAATHSATVSTSDVETALDRIDYELTSIRSEIAGYLPG